MSDYQSLHLLHIIMHNKNQININAFLQYKTFFFLQTHIELNKLIFFLNNMNKMNIITMEYYLIFIL